MNIKHKLSVNVAIIYSNYEDYMDNIIKKTLGLLMFLLIIMSLTGCAATTPLPQNVMFVQPAPSIAPELSAFLGVWTGKWYFGQDVTLVVEAVHENAVEAIFSVGANALGGISPQDTFSYVRAEVINNKSFGWSSANNNRLVFEMQDGFKEIKGSYLEGSLSSSIDTVLHRANVDELKNITVRKYPYVIYSHPAKGRQNFDIEHNICWKKAEKETLMLPHDMRKYKMWEEVGRCIQEEYGWKPNAPDLKKDIKL